MDLTIFLALVCVVQSIWLYRNQKKIKELNFGIGFAKDCFANMKPEDMIHKEK